MEIDEMIREILGEVQDCSAIMNDTPLLEGGFLDSISILYLITELEANLDVIIPLEQITEKNFATIDKIKAFVQECINRKKQ